MAPKALFFLVPFLLLVISTQITSMEGDDILTEMQKKHHHHHHHWHATAPAPGPLHHRHRHHHAPPPGPAAAPVKPPVNHHHHPKKHHAPPPAAHAAAPVKPPVQYYSPKNSPIYSPKNSPTYPPEASSGHHHNHGNCVDLCMGPVGYCRRLKGGKRECERVCVPCCHRHKCVPAGPNKKCASWDLVWHHGRYVKCP